MKKVLITGGAGFIGSNLADALLSRGYFVIVVDDLRSGFLENIEHLKFLKNFVFINANVNNFFEISDVFFKYKPDFVFHYAAMVGVEKTLDNPFFVFEDVDGIKNILTFSKLCGVKRILYSSSSEVYGDSIHRAQSENETPLNARLPYAIVKNLGEAYLRAYQEKYNLDFTIFRFFNTYGPKQSLDFVVTRFINQALKNQNITIIGNGEQTRSFCFISDNIKATINALESKRALNEIINIGSDVEISINYLAKLILQITKSKSKIIHLPGRASGDMIHRCPDISKMKRLLNIKEETNLKVGMEKFINWYKKINYVKKN
jgi:UDP-glucose 4-epimerase